MLLKSQMRALPTSPVEAYNFGLMANDMLDLTNCSIMVDNEALYHICAKKAKLTKPDYSYINKVVSMAVLVATSGWRFNSSPSVKLVQNLIFDSSRKNIINTFINYSLYSFLLQVWRYADQLSDQPFNEILGDVFSTHFKLRCVRPRDANNGRHHPRAVPDQQLPGSLRHQRRVYRLLHLLPRPRGQCGERQHGSRRASGKGRR